MFTHLPNDLSNGNYFILFHLFRSQFVTSAFYLLNPFSNISILAFNLNYKAFTMLSMQRWDIWYEYGREKVQLFRWQNRSSIWYLIHCWSKGEVVVRSELNNHFPIYFHKKWDACKWLLYSTSRVQYDRTWVDSCLI